MFAVVRTGGKQYRVAAGDKIAVEKLAGDAGDTIRLGEVLLAGEGDSLADAAKVVVSAEIIAQDRSEKVTVFKKRRRHNYRRKAGHRQSMTLLRIVSVGDSKAEKKAAAPKAEAAPKVDAAPAATHEAERQEPAKGAEVVKETPKSSGAKKAAPVKDAAPSKPADENAPAKKAPAKPAAKKAPKADDAKK
jgi:large subunit ribosomal protein L21